jgi:hypothetical protein
MCHDDIAMMDMEGIMVYDCIRGSLDLWFGDLLLRPAVTKMASNQSRVTVMPPALDLMCSHFVRAIVFGVLIGGFLSNNAMHSSNEMPCPSFSVSEAFRPGENQELCPVSGSVISPSSLPSGAAGVGWKRHGTPH